jgi:hypothetical protein
MARFSVEDSSLTHDCRVEPLLYRIVSIDVFPIAGLPWVTVNIMHAVIHQKPPTFFHGAVRHLMLHHSDVYEMILSSCSGMEDLCLTKSSVVEHAWIPLIERLPLRRLCAYFNLFSMLSPANRVFSRLTHLCLMGKIKDTKSTVKALIALPKLTHLSLDGHTFAHKCHEIPELPRSISVVILFRDSPAEWEVAEVVTLLAQDVRFVLMNMPNLLKDWQLGATGGKDYWSAAESFVAKRRTREIDRAYRIWTSKTANSFSFL